MSAIRYRLSSQLKFNIKQHLDREFINTGLYINIGSGHYHPNGTRADVLNRVSPFIYESYFDNWIYETDASGVAPYNTLAVSGVYINGGFVAKGAGTYKPSIDYARGRVMFLGQAPPAGTTVNVPFSYKHVKVDFPNARITNLVYSYLKDQVDYTNNIYPSGAQRQLPCVIIDVQRRIPSPYELGGGKQYDTLIVLHVLSNTSHENDQIVDILTESMYHTVIKGVDFNNTPQLFTNYGDLAGTYVNYTDLQGNISYRFPNIYIDNAELASRQESNGLFISRVNWSTKVYKSLSP